jgi:glyoxylase-like metal-dependent hydrolase (beta-lactamase superfamily II)
MRRSTRIRPISTRQLSRRGFLGSGLGLAGAAGSAALAGSLTPLLARAQPAAAITSVDLGELLVFQGAGCNVTVLPGQDGALMIDGGLAANARALLEAVFAASGNDSIELLIDTHWHAEQIGANELVGAAGGEIFAHEKTAMYLGNPVRPTAFDAERDALPESARPGKTTRGDGTLEFDGRRIDFGYLPQAHTDGDLYVHFPDLDVLVAGGVVSGEHWPVLDYHNGAWYGGRVRALEWLAELVSPATRVVTDVGRLIDGREVMRQRDIYLELFETLIGFMNKGYGAEDAVRDNPLAPYAAEYGDASAFLDGAYRSMLIAYVPE